MSCVQSVRIVHIDGQVFVFKMEVQVVKLVVVVDSVIAVTDREANMHENKPEN